MRTKLTIILLVLANSIAQSQISCEKYSDNYIPIDLEDAINLLDCTWSDSLKTEFRNTPKTELFMYGGMGMRNGWNLWQGKNKLSKYFHKLGIYHPDDISSIVIESYHRKLNDEPILLKDQVNYYIAYWNEVKIKDKITFDSLNIIFEQQYNNLNKGDTVEIQFNLHNDIGTRIQNYPVYEDECNCMIKGIVEKKNLRPNKYFYGRFELHIKLIETCERREIRFWMEDTVLKRGKKYKFFNLNNYRISKLNRVTNTW